MKKWLIKNDDVETVKKISEALGISELTAKVLIHRGITEIDDAKIFLDPENEQEFHDPFLMYGMQDAVDRIIVALEGGEKICVYGDYDVDGMSGSAILVRALRRLGGNIEPYIPHRAEGYGLNVPALKKIIASGVTLLISVDCGISNKNEIAKVKEELDFIITDHHLPPEVEDRINPDDVIAVIDHKQPECEYPDKNLCGAGVAFKLCQALAQETSGIKFSEYTTDIDIATLATVADIVPLTGENRKIVKIGLDKMRDSKCIGLRALIKVAGLENKKILASSIAFQIAPRLNSIGRLKAAKIGLELLLTEDEIKAEEMANELDTANTDRKRVERETFLQANEKVKKQREFSDGNMWTIIVADKSWNPGVIGLTASKLVEKYGMPTIVISGGDGIISRGSCRSIPALHMKDALDSMKELFDNYGGHSQAAGFSIPTKSIDELKRRFDKYVKDHLTDEDFTEVREIDALIHPANIDVKTAEEFEKLEPCGINNPEPVLACRNVHCNFAKAIGVDNSHLSFMILNDSEGGDKKNIKAVSFGNADLVNLVENEHVDFVYKIGLDTWSGEARLNCYVSDIVPTDFEKIPITRENLVDVYKFLKILRQRVDNFDVQVLTELFNEKTDKKFSVAMMSNALTIFQELGLVKVNESARTFDVPRTNKRDLENSRTFRMLSRR